jgi:NAD(P)H-hydrate epimerase
MKYLSKKELKLPKRKNSSKKGDNGKVLVIGGSQEYVGAVALAGLAALRSGADWVTIVAPEKVAWVINCQSPDLVVQKYKEEYFKEKHVKYFLDMEQKYDVVLIGNGMGTQSDEFISSYISKSKKPKVIDADALKCISLDTINASILTPHKTEFDMLLKNSNIASGKDLQSALKDNVVILKGKEDKIMNNKKIIINKTGNPGMTKAGTGDVLAGLAAGFYAQTKNSFEAAKLAAYYNGQIGDRLLKKKKGYCFLASDMVEEIKRIVK